MIEHHDDDLDTPSEEDRTESRRPALSPRTSRVLTLVFSVVVVLSVVAGTYFYLKLDRLDSQLDERAAAARVAERFTVQFNTFEPESMDSYVDAMNELLTTAAQAKLESAMEGTLAAIEESDLTSEGTLLASGVAHLDRDDATVLVVADAEADSVYGPRQRHFRWEVSLDKVDGEWLVDDFSPVQ